jgi:hypothetical protein
MHPVLEQQNALEGGGSVSAAAPGADEYLGGEFFGGAVNGKVPGVVAGLMLGAIATLIALRLAGFRFSFGVNVGGGS